MPRTLIIGAGRSAFGAAKLLKKLGRQALVSDITARYPEQLDALRDEGFEVLIGPQTNELLEGISELIVSPGLSPDIPLLQRARALGLPIRSEIDLALAHFNGQVIGVTGTNGKSTTTTLIAHILQKLGFHAVASGNIGVPPSLLLAEPERPDILVLELSSYQLDFSLPIVNRASLFMSFSEDHMERHKTMAKYFAAKWKLIEATEPSGLCIMPRSIIKAAQEFGCEKPRAPLVQILVDREKPRAWAPGPSVHFNSNSGRIHGEGIRGERQLPANLGFHNQLNVLAAVVAVQALEKTPWDRCVVPIASYSWLPYRFEKIGSFRSFPVYNDSKSTNVESTLVAMRSLRQPAVLMLGGHHKGESFHAITTMADRIQKLIVFGSAGPRIADELRDLEPQVFHTLREALEHLPQILEERPAPLVFSPACSSFDEFNNFEERGAFFNQSLQHILDPT